MTSSTADIVRSAFQAVQSCDLADLPALLSPDHVFEQVDALPWSGCYIGIDAFRRVVFRMHAHVEWTAEVEALIDTGPEFIVCGRTRGHVRATGLPFDVPFVNVYEVRDEHIVRSRAMIDEGDLQAAFTGKPAIRRQTLLVRPPST